MGTIQAPIKRKPTVTIKTLEQLIMDTQTRSYAAFKKRDNPLADRLWAEYRLLDAVADLINDPPSTDAIGDAAISVAMHTDK